MSFVKDNKAYEAWLAEHCDVVRKDLKYKHKRMEKNVEGMFKKFPPPEKG